MHSSLSLQQQLLYCGVRAPRFKLPAVPPCVFHTLRASPRSLALLRPRLAVPSQRTTDLSPAPPLPAHICSAPSPRPTSTAEINCVPRPRNVCDLRPAGTHALCALSACVVNGQPLFFRCVCVCFGWSALLSRAWRVRGAGGALSGVAAESAPSSPARCPTASSPPASLETSASSEALPHTRLLLRSHVGLNGRGAGREVGSGPGSSGVAAESPPSSPAAPHRLRLPPGSLSRFYM